ncbi:MAG: hypothetical protein M1825_004536 [Sarcosagium campestre]|nr:MAG: hypothetical protein M1825_004536 [Sarcosagium campestre]
MAKRKRNESGAVGGQDRIEDITAFEPAIEPTAPRRSKKTRLHKAQKGQQNGQAGSLSTSQEQPRRKRSSAPNEAHKDGLVDDTENAEQDQVVVGSKKPSSEARNEEAKKKKKKVAIGDAQNTPSRAHRFTVFIGNLPFTATTESIARHFASVKPSSVRHRTHKDDPTQSKGFAFLDFDGYESMQNCLRLFHHSQFDDGLAPARRVNVELSAGGGGNKSKQRIERIQTKNVKLNEERSRRAHAEDEKKRGKKGQAPDADRDDSAGNVHPSRRRQMTSN